MLFRSLRGNIFIYQGEELGLPQADIAFEHLRDPEAIANWPLTLGRDGARTPLPWEAKPMRSKVPPWLPVPDEHLALAVDAQEQDPGSQLAFTRRVLSLRNRSPALTHGTIHVLEASADVLAFERRSHGEQMLCVFNLGNAPRTWSPPDVDAWRIVEVSRTLRDWTLPGLSGLVAQRNR